MMLRLALALLLAAWLAAPSTHAAEKTISVPLFDKASASGKTKPAPTDTVHAVADQSVEIDLTEDVKDAIVGNSDIADVMVQSRRKIFIVGRAAGQTSLTLLNADGNAFRHLQVEVAIDATAVKEVLRRILPDEPGLGIEAAHDSLYLTGTVKSDAAASLAKTIARHFVASDANLVTLLRVANDQQVLLHVKVAEVQRTVLKELGLGLNATKAIPLIGSVSLNGGTSATTGLINASASALFGSATVTGIGSLAINLNLLENQGLIRTLVEPNLTAVSGETATMLAGGELPIPVSQVNGAISVEYKPYGVLLGFTPTVLDPGRLSLKLSTEVSSIDTANATAISATISVPAFKVRRASSTVELSSGGSIMIAGLLQNDITSDVAGLPGLMDLPVLGRLFRSDSFQRNETELVVILSAYIVQAADHQESLSAPTDGFAPSSDIKRFLLGRLQDTYTTKSKEAPSSPPQLQGPYGYIVQ